MKNMVNLSFIIKATSQAREVELFLDHLIGEITSKIDQDGEICLDKAETEQFLENLKTIRKVNHGGYSWGKIAIGDIVLANKEYNEEAISEVSEQVEM